MKKILMILSIVAIAANVNAQDKKNVIKANPLGLLFGSANLAYEKAINEKNSFVIAPSFGGYKLAGFKYSSFGLGAEYRFYFGSKPAPASAYIAPGLGYTSGKVKTEDVFGLGGTTSEAKFGAFYGKAIIGKQWIWSSGFTLDLNGGIQYINYSYSDNSGSEFSGLKASGIIPAVGLSIGYAF